MKKEINKCSYTNFYDINMYFNFLVRKLYYISRLANNKTGGKKITL